MGFFSNVYSGIGSALRELFNIVKKFVVTIIAGVLDFASEIINWFRGLCLDPKKQTPFIVDANRMQELIKEAPVVDCGIFEGVYNEETNKIDHYKEIQADSLNPRAREVLDQASDDNPIVVLN